MNDNYIGKKVKLNDYNLTYGSKEKQINILCLYKNLKDNSMYAICCEDSNIPYGIINYGTSHIKNNTLIVIGSKNPDIEGIKEIIYKLDDNTINKTQIISLEEIEQIEIISPNKLEIKEEIIKNIINKTIPKPKEQEKNTAKNKKKKSKILPILLIFIIILFGIYYFFIKVNNNNSNITKTITCKTEYRSREVNANVEEDNTYNFNSEDILEYINKSTTYKFHNEDEYYDFINKSLYKYAKESVGYSNDDINYKINIIEKEEIKEDYQLPTEYEEVIKYYKSQNYKCREKIEK